MRGVFRIGHAPQLHAGIGMRRHIEPSGNVPWFTCEHGASSNNASMGIAAVGVVWASVGAAPCQHGRHESSLHDNIVVQRRQFSGVCDLTIECCRACAVNEGGVVCQHHSSGIHAPAWRGSCTPDQATTCCPIVGSCGSRRRTAACSFGSTPVRPTNAHQETPSDVHDVSAIPN